MGVYDDFSDLISTLEDNPTTMGVSDAEFDSTTGIMGLVDKILNIPPSVGGINVVTAVSCNVSSESIATGNQINITGVLEADKDDTTSTNVDLEGYLKGATIGIYDGDTLLGSTVTNANGEYSYIYTPLVSGTLSLKAVFDGTDDYESCYSSNVSVSVKENVVYFSRNLEETLIGGSGWKSIATGLTDLPLNFKLTVDLYTTGLSTGSEQRLFLCPSTTWNGGSQPSQGIWVGYNSPNHGEYGFRNNSSSWHTSYLDSNHYPNVYNQFKVVRSGSSWVFYINEQYIDTLSYSNMSSYSEFTLCAINWASGQTFKWKNLIIEEL